MDTGSNLVLDPIATTRTPCARESSVPEWPAFLIFKICLIRFTQAVLDMSTSISELCQKYTFRLINANKPRMYRCHCEIQIITNSWNSFFHFNSFSIDINGFVRCNLNNIIQKCKTSENLCIAIHVVSNTKVHKTTIEHTHNPITRNHDRAHHCCTHRSE